MATRKKGAAGVKPAAVIPAVADTAAPVLVDIAAETSSAIVVAVAGAVDDGAVEGVAATVATALSDAGAVVDAAKANDEQVIFAQQPGQIASALVAPVLGIETPVGGIISEPVLLADGYPAEIEVGGRTMLVQSRSQRGRWRIGRHFTTTPTPVEIDELTEEQVERLLADPELLVSFGY